LSNQPDAAHQNSDDQ